MAQIVSVPRRGAGSRVLVVGVYLLDAPTRAAEITEALRSTVHDVDISWAALGHQQVPGVLANVTRIVVSERREKFTLINQLLSGHSLSDYDVLLVTDDDVDLDPGWLDTFLALQADADLALCQPARSPDSWIDHPFTKQLLGIDARLTRFVEIGPVFAIRREAFELLVPFDESWPMGWGLDLRWPVLIGEAGLQMGIIDRAPVTHRMRPPQSHYSPDDTRARMTAALKPGIVLERDIAQRTLATRVDGSWAATEDLGRGDPKISVVIATRDRQDLLRRALGALVAQTLDRDAFEIIVIDDGSEDTTRQVVESFAHLLVILYARQEPSGIASARNHGLSFSRGEVVIFLDDDDVADTSLLMTHVKAHRRFRDRNVGILGHTDLAADVENSFLMRHITGASGNQLFSYQSMTDQGILEFTELWGGRASLKRAWLMAHEIFDPQFDFGSEDIELGYRLSRHGLTVRYEARARSTMIRTMTLRGLLQRATQQGRSIAKSFALHREAAFTRPIFPAAEEHFCCVEPDSELVETVTRHTQAMLDLADDALQAGVALAPSVVEEIGSCINYLHTVHMSAGYRRYMLAMPTESDPRSDAPGSVPRVRGPKDTRTEVQPAPAPQR